MARFDELFCVCFSVTGRRDVPGGPVVENAPCKTEDKDLIPGQGTKIPYASEQLSPHTASTELHALEPTCCN